MGKYELLTSMRLWISLSSLRVSGTGSVSDWCATARSAI